MDYDVFDIANYIVEYSNKLECGVNNIKLQALLYLVYEELSNHYQVFSFNEKFVEWKCGPISEKVHSQFSHNLNKNILNIEDDILKFAFSHGKVMCGIYKYNSKRIKNEDKVIIERIILENKDEYSWDLMKEAKELYNENIMNNNWKKISEME